MGFIEDTLKKYIEPEVIENKEDKGNIQSENTVHNTAYRIYSAKIDQYLWLVQDNEMAEALINDGITEPIFTFQDINFLNETMSKETLQMIHDCKKIFQGSKVVNVKQDLKLDSAIKASTENDTGGDNSNPNLCEICHTREWQRLVWSLWKKPRSGWAKVCLVCEPYPQYK